MVLAVVLPEKEVRKKAATVVKAVKAAKAAKTKNPGRHAGRASKDGPKQNEKNTEVSKDQYKKKPIIKYSWGATDTLLQDNRILS